MENFIFDADWIAGINIINELSKFNAFKLVLFIINIIQSIMLIDI